LNGCAARFGCVDRETLLAPLDGLPHAIFRVGDLVQPQPLDDPCGGSGPPSMRKKHEGTATGAGLQEKPPQFAIYN